MDNTTQIRINPTDYAELRGITEMMEEIESLPQESSDLMYEVAYEHIGAVCDRNSALRDRDMTGFCIGPDGELLCYDGRMQPIHLVS